jgi:glycosyltransferase involved in cell wall biosynthesis
LSETIDTQSQKLNLKTRRYHQQQKLIVFDLDIYGHHPAYIQHLVQYWCEQQLPGQLDIVVSPQFLQVHADVVELLMSYGEKKVNFVAIALAEQAALFPRNSPINRNRRAWQEWQLLCKYVDALGANYCLIMHFDPYLLPLTFGIKPSCRFSGIYFKPTLHYPQFPNYSLTWKSQLQQRREKLLLRRNLQTPQLQTLFTLDPFAVNPINQLCRQSKAIYLPDPVVIPQETASDASQLRETLGIESGRKVFLLFGALTKRKGIDQLLEAIRMLPLSVCKKLCLALVGKSNANEKKRLQFQIATVRHLKSVQIIEHYEFVSEQKVPAYFQMADVVLGVYQQHVGMSGILLLAAAAQKPVLSSDYGLMGEITRRYRLGLAVDATQPREIAKGLTRFLHASGDQFWDRDQMKQLAAQNSPHQFAQTILENL